jgi:hypothetical protein
MAKARTDKRISVYLPATLYEQLTKLPKLNRSRVCRIALEEAVSEHLGDESSGPASESMAKLPFMERDLRNMRSVFGRFAREAAEHAGLVIMTEEEAEKLTKEKEAEKPKGGTSFTPDDISLTGTAEEPRPRVVRTESPWQPPVKEATPPEVTSSTSPHRAGEPRTCGRCDHLLFEDMLCHQPNSANHREERSPDDEACAEFDRKCKNCGHWGSVHGKRRDDVLGSWMFCDGGLDEDGEGAECDCTASPCEVFGSCVCDSEHCSVYTNEVIAQPPSFPPETKFLDDDAELEWLLPAPIFKKIWVVSDIDKEALRHLKGPPIDVEGHFTAPIAGRALKRGGSMILRELPMELASTTTQRKIVVNILTTEPAERYQDSAQVRFTFEVVERQKAPPCVGTNCAAEADAVCSKCGAPLCWACWSGDSGVDEEPVGLCPSCSALNKPAATAEPTT